MLGIAAQESNMWQAARFAVPGVTANPLIGNYYGLDIYNGTEADDWTIHWDKADCGYGVTQVTDGMRLAGREKGPERPGAGRLPDAAGGRAGLRRQHRRRAADPAGQVEPDPRGRPDDQQRRPSAKIENWFFAVWAYNTGLLPAVASGGERRRVGASAGPTTRPTRSTRPTAARSWRPTTTATTTPTPRTRRTGRTRRR